MHTRSKAYLTLCFILQKDFRKAARAGNVEGCKILLQAGANINGKDLVGNIALHFACLEGHLEVVEFLINSGSDVDAVTNVRLSFLKAWF